MNPSADRARRTGGETARVGAETGSAAVEMAVLALPLLALLLLVVLAGRVSQADADVSRAAGEAARAASIRQDPGAAAESARAVAASNLARSGVACVRFDTAVDTSDFRPGGTVVVTVRCTASMADVTLLGVPGERTFVARSVASVDRFRAGQP